MSQKQWIGVAFLVIGIIALIFSHYITQRVEGETGKVRGFTEKLSHISHPAGRGAGEAINQYAEGEASGYMQTAQLLRVGGIVLILLGGGVLFYYRKKNKKR